MNQTTASRIVDAFPLHSTILRQFPQKPETPKNRLKPCAQSRGQSALTSCSAAPLLRRQVMKRPGIARVIVTLLLGAPGCLQPASRPEYVEVVQNLQYAAHRPPESVRPDDPDAAALDPDPTPPDLLGPQPVDAYIRQALRENRTVQAARFNLLALKARIPQVTALDDPLVSNTIYPIPSVAPQYSLMGYNPYNVLIAQQFPWIGTLCLRGQAAEKDVEVALAELAAAELTVVADVKRAYYDLYFNEQAAKILGDNRKLAVDFITIAKARYATGNTGQQDVLRAEVVVTDLDRELLRVSQGLA